MAWSTNCLTGQKRRRSKHLVTNSLRFCDKMVEVVLEEIDNTVLRRKAQVKVQTVGRGIGQGTY